MTTGLAQLPIWGTICSSGHKRLKANKPPFLNHPSKSRYNDALADYVQEKQGQVERLEDRLENLIEQEMANLEELSGA